MECAARVSILHCSHGHHDHARSIAVLYARRSTTREGSPVSCRTQRSAGETRQRISSRARRLPA